MAFSSCFRGLSNTYECLPLTVRDLLAAAVVGGREAILPGLVWFWMYQIADSQVVPDGAKEPELAEYMARAALIAAAFIVQLPLYAGKYAITEREVSSGASDDEESAEAVVTASKPCDQHWLAKACLNAMTDTLGDMAFPLSNALWNALVPADLAGKLVLVAVGDGVLTGSANLVLRAAINACRSKESYRTPWPAAASTALGSLGFTLAEGAANGLKLDTVPASFLVLAGVTVGQAIVIWFAMPSRNALAEITPSATAGPAASLRGTQVFVLRMFHPVQYSLEHHVLGKGLSRQRAMLLVGDV